MDTNTADYFHLIFSQTLRAVIREVEQKSSIQITINGMISSTVSKALEIIYTGNTVTTDPQSVLHCLKVLGIELENLEEVPYDGYCEIEDNPEDVQPEPVPDSSTVPEQMENIEPAHVSVTSESEANFGIPQDDRLSEPETDLNVCSQPEPMLMVEDILENLADEGTSKANLSLHKNTHNEYPSNSVSDTIIGSDNLKPVLSSNQHDSVESEIYQPESDQMESEQISELTNIQTNAETGNEKSESEQSASDGTKEVKNVHNNNNSDIKHSKSKYQTSDTDTADSEQAMDALQSNYLQQDESNQISESSMEANEVMTDKSSDKAESSSVEVETEVGIEDPKPSESENETESGFQASINPNNKSLSKEQICRTMVSTKQFNIDASSLRRRRRNLQIQDSKLLQDSLTEPPVTDSQVKPVVLLQDKLSLPDSESSLEPSTVLEEEQLFNTIPETDPNTNLELNLNTEPIPEVNTGLEPEVKTVLVSASKNISSKLETQMGCRIHMI